MTPKFKVSGANRNLVPKTKTSTLKKGQAYLLPTKIKEGFEKAKNAI